jgi:hypothetical protein
MGGGIMSLGVALGVPFCRKRNKSFLLSSLQYVNNYDITAFIAGGSHSMELFVSPDGLKMFMTNVSIDLLAEFSMFPAWDVTSLTHVYSTTTALWGNTYPTDLFFSENGDYAYSISIDTSIRRYTLSTPWDIGLASMTNIGNYDLNSIITGPLVQGFSGIHFNRYGTKLYLSNRTGSYGIHQFTLGTAWDVSSASYD